MYVACGLTALRHGRGVTQLRFSEWAGEPGYEGRCRCSRTSMSTPSASSAAVTEEGSGCSMPVISERLRTAPPAGCGVPPSRSERESCQRLGHGGHPPVQEPAGCVLGPVDHWSGVESVRARVGACGLIRQFRPPTDQAALSDGLNAVEGAVAGPGGVGAMGSEAPELGLALSELEGCRSCPRGSMSSRRPVPSGR